MHYRHIAPWVLVALLLVPRVARTQTSGISGAFVDVGIGAASAGTAYAGGAAATGVRSLAWNVAGLADTERFEMSATYVDQLEQLSYEYAAVAIPIRRGKHAFGASVLSSGDAALRELSLQLAWAMSYHRVRFGLGLRAHRATFGRNVLNPDDLVVFDPDEITDGLSRQVSGDAVGASLDAGLAVAPYRDMMLTVGLRNVIAPVSWNGHSAVRADGRTVEHLPMAMDVGMVYDPSTWMRVHAAWAPAVHGDEPTRYSFGLTLRPVSVLALRAGRRLLHDGWRNESTALGFGVRIVEFLGLGLEADFAWITSPLADSRQFTLILAP